LTLLFLDLVIRELQKKSFAEHLSAYTSFFYSRG